LCDEYVTIAREFGYQINDLVRFAKNSIQVSCATIESKAKYILEVEKWVESNLMLNTSSGERDEQVVEERAC